MSLKPSGGGFRFEECLMAGIVIWVNEESKNALCGE